MKQYPAYPAYKSSHVSWLGDIPINWKVRRIKDVSLLVTGMTPPTADQENYSNDEKYHWVRPEDLTEPAGNTKASKFLSETGWSLSRIVRKYSTLICCIGTIGKTGYVSNAVATNQQITAAQFFKNHKYYFYVLNGARPEIELSAMGNVVRILNNERLGVIPLPVPSEEEADGIARFLDFKTAQIDALIAKKKALLDKLAEKRTALISHAVTKGLDPSVAMKDSGVAWLGEIPAHWVPKRMRFCMKTNPSKGEIKLNDDELVSFIPMEAVGEFGGLNLDAEKELREIGGGYTYFADHDVVVAKITPCFENGKGAIARGLKNGMAFGTTELHVMRSDNTLLPDYLFHLTMSHPFRCIGESEMYGAGGQKRVPESFLKDFRIGLPPVNEQQDIIDYINKVNQKLDMQMSKATDVIGRLTEYRSALITNAVTGKIDVRDVPVGQPSEV